MVNCDFPPKIIYRFNAISIKISRRLFIDIYKITLKFICEGKGTSIAKNDFEI